MVWVYEDPPFTEKEIKAYRSLKRKLKDRKFVDNLIKLISLYAHLKQLHPKTAEDIQKSAFYDKEHKTPIFDRDTAKKLLRILSVKGGDSKYPFFDTAMKGFVRDYIPFGQTLETLGSYPVAVVDFLKNNIPFADLMFELTHSGTEFGITSANGIGEAVGGPVGLVAVAPFTGIAAAAATALAAGEGDLGQAVMHVATWVPGLGIILNKGVIEAEKMAKVLKDHPYIASWVPYMTEYHTSLEPIQEPVTAGKRLSTSRRRDSKWTKTLRKKSATH